MIPDDNDLQRRINAETSLAHLKDQEKLIDNREKEAQKLLAPIRRRGAQNHFLQEARELMDRRLRGE
jgi:hypothetical protein